jgi:hypothetical protein
LKIIQPILLLVILRGENAGVEEDQNDDEPVEGLRLDCLPTETAESAV